MAAGTEGGGDMKAHDDPDREPKAAAQRILFAAGAWAQYFLEVASLMTESISGIGDLCEVQSMNSDDLSSVVDKGRYVRRVRVRFRSSSFDSRFAVLERVPGSTSPAGPECGASSC